MKQIVLDTETTGLEPAQGHKIIEIGAVELINREPTGKVYHQYINPQREVEEGALKVHGISNEFLQDKPVFSEVVAEFVNFIKDAELIIHNAPFDVGFIDHEFKLLNQQWGRVTDYCQIFDTLTLARKLHPGRKNNLDALCKRYDIDNSKRDLHGALLDAKILSYVYLAMTGGQVALFDDNSGDKKSQQHSVQSIIDTSQSYDIPIVTATAEELKAHQDFLSTISQASGHEIDWL